MEIEYTDAGDQVKRPAVLDYPPEVWDNPEDFTTWEAWLDGLMEGARGVYSELRKFLCMDNEERFDEMFRTRNLEREWRERSRAYHEEIIESFLHVLTAPAPLDYSITGPP